MAQDREIRSKADPAGRPTRVASRSPVAWLKNKQPAGLKFRPTRGR